jgi:glyoxylase I family protein
MRAADLDATIRFYREGLGFSVAYAWGEGDGRAVMLDAGDGVCVEFFAGGALDPVRAEGAILHYALRTGDCNAAYQRALAAGAQDHSAPQDVLVPGEPPLPIRIAFVRGLDGEIIEFFQNDRL